MKKIKTDEKKIVRLYQNGESALTIQKITGINYKTVYRILENNGIGRRTSSEQTINARKLGRGDYSKQKELASKNWQGRNNPRWKKIGSKRDNGHGYILIKTKSGWVEESRLIAEKILKRKLTKDETIHHINGIKNDNRLKNLFLMLRKEHKAWHTLDNLNKELKDIRPELKSNLITIS